MTEEKRGVPRKPSGLPPHSTTLREFSGRCNSIGNGFTLIELLTVIAVIGVLAALLLPVAGAVKRREYINTATAEMQKIETALERYKAQYGFYPPAGKNVLKNPLYAELVGTTNVSDVGGGLGFNSLDGNVQVMNPNEFGMSGFVNCSKPGAGGESSQAATDFIGELKTTQIAYFTNLDNMGTNALLVVSVGGPDASYEPIGFQGVNPWRYAYPGTNNPSSYDLWVQLVISGKTNLVCNWSDKVQLNAPYP
jgi:prepilin-type N-terminal cleavage/methylation domain-containing protein